jgi:hypothetical protein
VETTTQQRPDPYIDLGAVGTRHLRLFRPVGIGKGQAVATQGGGAAQIHIEIAVDVELATGARLHRALDRSLEPVPVPQQDQHHDRRDQQRERGQQAVARTPAAPSPAPGSRLFGCGGRGIHRSMVA